MTVLLFCLGCYVGAMLVVLPILGRRLRSRAPLPSAPACECSACDDNEDPQ